MNLTQSLDEIVEEKIMNVQPSMYAAKEFSSKMKYAWQVVERMETNGWTVMISNRDDYDGHWVVQFEKGGRMWQFDDDICAKAICLTALKAIETNGPKK